MKKLILVLSILTLSACGSLKQIPSSDSYTKVEYIERGRDTIIYVQVPVEKIVIQTLDTTSFIETSIAKSEATVSNGILKHSIENKKDSIKYVVKYKETIQRDTVLVDKEVPVEVEKIKEVVPKGSGYSLGFSILVVILLIIKIYLKFKR